mgnify:CR=1 FL=1
MVGIKWDERDNRVFCPTSVPTSQLIGLHIADRGEHKQPRELWFRVKGQRVCFRLDDIFAMWKPGNLHFSGSILKWPGHAELERHDFTLRWDDQPRSKKGVRRQKPVLTIHGVTPLCGVCGGGTNRHGWQFECPKSSCSYTIDDPNKPADTGQPDKCMSCGIPMVKAGSTYACPGCGATAKAT